MHRPLLILFVAAHLLCALACGPSARTCDDLANVAQRNECAIDPPPLGTAGFVPPGEAAKLCDATSECPAGSTCTLAGTCSRSTQCAKDSECAWDERCDARQCVKLPPPQPPSP